MCRHPERVHGVQSGGFHILANSNRAGAGVRAAGPDLHTHRVSFGGGHLCGIRCLVGFPGSTATNLNFDFSAVAEP